MGVQSQQPIIVRHENARSEGPDAELKPGEERFIADGGILLEIWVPLLVLLRALLCLLHLLFLLSVVGQRDAD